MASALPKPFVARWKAASKDGTLAMKTFVRLADVAAHERDLAWHRDVRVVLEKLKECATLCQEVVDDVCAWLERERRREPTPSTVCVAVVVEALVHEASLREQMVHSLAGVHDASGYHACLTAWKLDPFLSSPAVERALREMQFHEELAHRREVQERHGGTPNK